MLEFTNLVKESRHAGVDKLSEGFKDAGVYKLSEGFKACWSLQT